MSLASRRRRRWHKRRARRGLDQPRPTACMAVNFASVSAGKWKVRRIVKRTLRKARRHDVVVIWGCEAGKVRARWFGRDGDWEVLHDDDPPNGPRSGTLLAVRRDRTRMTRERLVKASRGGHGIRDRYIARARVEIDPETRWAWTLPTGAFHAPPKRAWVLWAGYMAVLKAQRLRAAGGDANKWRRAVARVFPGRRAVSDQHVMSIYHSRWIPASDPVVVDVGSDHPALLVVLFP